MKTNIWLLALLIGFSLFSLPLMSMSEEFYELDQGFGASVSASTSDKYIDIESGIGTDLISNGTFANTNGWILSSNFSVAGNAATFTPANSFANGAFATTNGWKVSGDWSIAAGVAKFITTTTSETTLTNQVLNVTSGVVYSIRYTVSDVDGVVAIAPVFGSVTGTLVTANGTYTENITPLASGTNFAFIGSSTDAATGFVDNVSLRVAGLVETGTLTHVIASGITSGRTYRVGYTVAGIDPTTNTLEVLVGTNSSGLITSDTIYTALGYSDIKSTSTSQVTFRVVATNHGTVAVSAVNLKQAPRRSKAKNVTVSVLPTDLPAYLSINCDQTTFDNSYSGSRCIIVSSNNSPVVIAPDVRVNKIWYKSASGTPTLTINGY